MQHRAKLILYEIYKSIKCFKDVLILIRNTNSSFISIFSNLFIDQIYIYKGLINVFFYLDKLSLTQNITKNTNNSLFFLTYSQAYLAYFQVQFATQGYVKNKLRCPQCRHRRHKRNRNVDDDVNTISYQHRRHCYVDIIDSTMGTEHERAYCPRFFQKHNAKIRHSIKKTRTQIQIEERFPCDCFCVGRIFSRKLNFHSRDRISGSILLLSCL